MGDIISIIRDNALLLLIGQYPQGPLGGLAITLLLSVISIVLAFPLGVVIALARLGSLTWLRWPATAAVYVVRSVPLIMFIFWVYFFVPRLIGHEVSGIATMLVTLVLYEAAYLAEIVRAGIEGLPGGQMEAARAVGLSYLAATARVTLPQALYNMVPALIGQFVSTIKDTSLAYIISVNDLTFAANQINSTLLTKPFEVFAILAGLYFVLCLSLTRLARHVEQHIVQKRASSDRHVAVAQLTGAMAAVEP